MRCEICGGDLNVIVTLPIRQPDGKLDTLACESCAVKNDTYCQKHERAHLGFEDGTTACTSCIEEMLVKDGERIAGMFAAAVGRSEKAPEIRQAINEWLEEIDSMLPKISLAELPLAIKFLETPHALNITRAIVTCAQRMNITPEKVIEKVAKEGPKVILPLEFTEEM